MFPVREGEEQRARQAAVQKANEVQPSKKGRREPALATKAPKVEQARSGAQHHTAPAISPLPAEAFCCGKPDPTEAIRAESGSAPWNGKPQIGPAAVGRKVRRCCAAVLILVLV